MNKTSDVLFRIDKEFCWDFHLPFPPQRLPLHHPSHCPAPPPNHHKLFGTLQKNFDVIIVLVTASFVISPVDLRYVWALILNRWNKIHLDCWLQNFHCTFSTYPMMFWDDTTIEPIQVSRSLGERAGVSCGVVIRTCLLRDVPLDSSEVSWVSTRDCVILRSHILRLDSTHVRGGQGRANK